MRVSRRVLHAVPYLLAALAALLVAVGVLTSGGSSSPTRAGPGVGTPTPTPTVTVAALRRRVPAHLLLLSGTAISAAQERAVRRATGARAALAVSAGTAFVERGRTTVLAGDPDTLRAWTPQGMAESDPLWQSVAAGDGAVAHVVGRAFELPLGGTVLTQVVFPLRLSVGAFATSALPGVGLIVSDERAAELGLQPRTGLLLSVPQRSAEASAALARKAVPGLTVSAVRYERVPVTRAGWVVPVVGRVSSGFGLRLHPIKKAVLFHDGIDIAAPLGAPVHAMSDGVVLYAGPARGYGNQVVLSHPGGVVTVYGHVSTILVTGGAVRAGQPIALVGNEGDSTGPHLHAEVRVGDRPQDPVRWLRAHGVRL